MRCVSTALFVAVVVLSAINMKAQKNPEVPMRYGGHLGLNFNMSGVGYADWLMLAERPAGSFNTFVLNDGTGLGLYAGLDIQWMLMNWLGLNLRLSYDNRSLTANDDRSYNDPPNDFDDEFNFHQSMINFEAVGKLYLGDAFHFTGGGGVAFRMQNTFDYRLNSQDPVVEGPQIEGSDIIGSFVGGLGYDIFLSNPQEKTQMILTPFLEATYMAGMSAVQLEDQAGFDDRLSIATIRAGVALMWGEVRGATSEMGVAPMPSKFFRVLPPEDGMYLKRITEEYHPIRPHVFFDKGNTAVPSRYNNITSADTAGLIEHASSGWTEEDLKDESAKRYRQGEVYYNILNIVGYRMNRTPNATLTLIGSDPAERNGDQLAESAKKYLVDTWGVDAGRITTQGQVNPRIPSGSARTPAEDRPNAEIENRRVEVTSNDPSIMRRAVIKAEEDAKEENEVYIGLDTDEDITSWSGTIKGNGKTVSFGPNTDKETYVDPTGLMTEGQTQARFVAEVIAKTSDGRTLSDTVGFTMKLNNTPAQAQRHALTFEYGEDEPVKRSGQYLSDIAKTIPNNATIYVSGFTDNLGSEEANMKLSQQRANEVKDELAKMLKSAGKKATLRAKGYGEKSDRSPFPNDLPEGRMYNRTVLIDIFP